MVSSGYNIWLVVLTKALFTRAELARVNQALCKVLMGIIKARMFSVLNDQQVEQKLIQLYQATVKEWPKMILHFLPKVFGLLRGKGLNWKSENTAFYEDKYIPIHPNQGTFLYLQARALNAKSFLEFGTSYGISTIYLAKAAQQNGGKVITTEYLPHKVEKAKKNIEEAGLSDYVEILQGDAKETLKNLDVKFDFVLLDGWPDLVFDLFKLIEQRLNKNAVIIVDDVEGFQPDMQDYLNYVRNPENGYLSTTLKPGKALEFTVKVS